VKINSEVERAVRKALAGAVAEETGRFESAILELADKGDSFAGDALVLILAIDSAALFSIHEGQRPDDEQLRYLAQAFQESQAWATIPEGQPLKFLTAIADGKPVQDVIPLGDLVTVAFVVGAWLLTAFLPEGKDWTDLLDLLLERIEATPVSDG
jgi:hypothetical protein